MAFSSFGGVNGGLRGGLAGSSGQWTVYGNGTMGSCSRPIVSCMVNTLRMSVDVTHARRICAMGEGMVAAERVGKGRSDDLAGVCCTSAGVDAEKATEAGVRGACGLSGVRGRRGAYGVNTIWSSSSESLSMTSSCSLLRLGGLRLLECSLERSVALECL